MINQINAADPDLNFSNPVGSNPYLDVDGDSRLSPLDVLGVINQINKTSTSLNVQLELRNDSGLSQNDKITNDSALIGQFGGSSGVEYVVKARVNRGPVLDLNFDSAKRFSFEILKYGDRPFQNKMKYGDRPFQNGDRPRSESSGNAGNLFDGRRRNPSMIPPKEGDLYSNPNLFLSTRRSPSPQSLRRLFEISRLSLEPRASHPL